MKALTPRRILIAAAFIGGVVAAALAPSEEPAQPTKRASKPLALTGGTPPAQKSAAREVEVPPIANYTRSEQLGVNVSDLFEPRPVPGAAPPAPKPPEAPKLPFSFTGVIGESGNTKAVLLQGDQIFIVAKGEQFGGAYRLEEFDMEKIVVIYLPLDVRQSLSLGEAK